MGGDRFSPLLPPPPAPSRIGLRLRPTKLLIFNPNLKDIVTSERSTTYKNARALDKLFTQKLHFSNDAFQSYKDLFQVNWLVQI